MPRKQKLFHFIYKTTNILTKKYYIGMHSTNNLDDGYMGSGKKLAYSIRKYGQKNHKVEIIEYLSSREELSAREKDIVNLNELAKNNCMNLRVGGLGGHNSQTTEEIKKKISGTQKERYKNGAIIWNKGHKNQTKLNLSKEQIEQRRIAQNKIWMGRKHNAKSIAKMSVSHIGQIPWHKGKTDVYSKEVLKKMSESMSGKNHPNFSTNHSGMSGKTHSVETKKKMSISRTGKKNGMSGISLMDRWISKYGQEEADVRYNKWKYNMSQARIRRDIKM